MMEVCEYPVGKTLVRRLGNKKPSRKVSWQTYLQTHLTYDVLRILFHILRLFGGLLFFLCDPIRRPEWECLCNWEAFGKQAAAINHIIHAPRTRVLLPLSLFLPFFPLSPLRSNSIFAIALKSTQISIILHLPSTCKRKQIIVRGVKWVKHRKNWAEKRAEDINCRCEICY